MTIHFNYYQGHTYGIVDTAMTWDEAAEFAQQQGGYLSIVSNSGENTFILDAALALNGTGGGTAAPTASDGGGSAYVWLGASDADTEGVWTWVDSTAVSGYTPWGSGNGVTEPDDFNGQDNLGLALEPWPAGSGAIGDTGGWNDVDGANQLWAVIEWDILAGSDDDNVVLGSDLSETFETYAGNDVATAGDGNDSVNAGEGNDQVWAGGSDTGNDLFYGGDGNDTLGSGAGNDSIYGENGNDVLFGGTGTDYISGGAGQDTAWSGNGNDTILGGNNADIFGGGGGADSLVGGAGNDTIYGAAGADIADGAGGNDQVYGGDGNDTLTGGAGDDSIFGGNGNDTLIFEANHGDDYVGAFETKGDNTLDLSALNLSGFGALGISQSGADVVIDTGEGTITLWNTNTGEITAGDFVF